MRTNFVQLLHCVQISKWIKLRSNFYMGKLGNDKIKVNGEASRNHFGSENNS